MRKNRTISFSKPSISAVTVSIVGNTRFDASCNPKYLNTSCFIGSNLRIEIHVFLMISFSFLRQITNLSLIENDGFKNTDDDLGLFPLGGTQ